MKINRPSGPRRPYKFRKKLMGFIAASTSFVAAQGSFAQAAKDSFSDDEKKALNEVSIAEAQMNFNTIAKFAETSFSRTIDSLETATNKKIDAKHPDSDWDVVFIDQQHVDVAYGLGFRVSGVLKQLNTTPYIISPESIEYANFAMGEKYKSDYGIEGYWTKPFTVRDNYRDDPEAVFIFTGSYHTMSSIYKIPGMTTQQNVMFNLLHETAHGSDDIYLGQPIDQEQLSLQYQDVCQRTLDKELTAEDFMMGYESEVYADVSALGQMIRTGADPQLINAVAAWRASAAYGERRDHEHLSTPVLRAFKKHIQKMGIETFRAMSDEEAEKFYTDMVGAYGMTLESFRILDRYEQAIKGKGNPDDINAIIQLARHDRNAKKAMEFNAFFNDSAYKAVKTMPDDETRELVDHMLAKWDALTELQDTAFALDGRITIASVTKAYGRMQEGFIQKIRKDPARADLYQEQMTYLQRVYITNLKRMDYADLNVKYGVSLPDIRNGL